MINGDVEAGVHILRHFEPECAKEYLSAEVAEERNLGGLMSTPRPEAAHFTKDREIHLPTRSESHAGREYLMWSMKRSDSYFTAY